MKVTQIVVVVHIATMIVLLKKLKIQKKMVLVLIWQEDAWIQVTTVTGNGTKESVEEVAIDNAVLMEHADSFHTKLTM